MKRRRRGAGAIEVTRDGKYRARFSFENGKREDIDGSPFATYAEAERALAPLAELAARGGALESLKAHCDGVYFIQVGIGPVKIGYGGNISQRVCSLQVAHWEPVELRAYDRGASKLDEIQLHSRFAHARIRGEWFWPVDDLMRHIRSIRAREAVRQARRKRA